MKHYQLQDHDMIPLLAVLVGNDHIDTKTFEKVFTQIPLPKKQLCPRHLKMEGLLNWLSREPDVQTAVQKLMEFFPKTERENLKSVLESGLATYRLETCTVADVNEAIDRVIEDEAASLPFKINDFLMRLSRSAESAMIITPLVNRAFFSRSMVEVEHLKSANEFTLPIFSAFLRVVFSIQGQLDGKLLEIKAIFRKGRKCATFPIALRDPVNNLKSRQEKLNFLMKSLGVPDKVAAKEDLMLACLWYWCHNDPDQTPASMQLFAVAFCLKMKDITNDEQKKKIRKFEALNLYGLSGKPRKFDRELIHSFSNLQATIIFANELNLLLERPVSQVDILFWNGSIHYNICQEFRLPNHVIRHFSFDQTFKDDTMNLYQEWIQQLEIDETKTVTMVENTRKKKRQRRPVVIRNDDDTGTDSDNNDENAFRDFNNRFSALTC